MARYSPAYSSFLLRLDEIGCLNGLATLMERQDPIGQEERINALCRGAVVLLCSHVEAYIKDLGSIGLGAFYSRGVNRSKIAPQMFYHISKGQIKSIRKSNSPEAISARVFEFLENHLEYWSKEDPFSTEIDSENFNRGFSNPGFKKIRRYFHRFGYSDYPEDLKVKLGQDFFTVTTMINHLVNTRNKIAHGDQNALQTPEEIKIMIPIIKVFCRETDVVVGKWWKENFCPLR